MVWVISISFLLLMLIVMGIFGRGDVVPWIDHMRRVKIRGAKHGEWLAPEEIMSQVVENYREYLHFSQQTLVRGWSLYVRDMERYLAGDFLSQQRTHLEARLRKNTLRLIDILRCDHEVRIRNFSDDGLNCLLIDYQTERRLATYHYWSKRRIHTQHLDDAICVYLMTYDREDERWKIKDFIQELPSIYYLNALKGPIDNLDLSLLGILGRDQ